MKLSQRTIGMIIFAVLVIIVIVLAYFLFPDLKQIQLTGPQGIGIIIENFPPIVDNTDRESGEENTIKKIDQACPENETMIGLYSNGTIICKAFEKSIPQTLKIEARLAPYTNIDILNQAGLFFNQQGKYENAIAVYNAGLELQPTNKHLLNNKGISWKNLGNFSEAIKNYDLALAQDPFYEHALINKGISLNLIGNSNQALELFEQVLSRNPNNIEALSAKGKTLGNMGNFAQSKNTFEMILKIDQNNIDALHGKAIALTNMGFYGEALEFYNKALELDPNNELIKKHIDLINSRLESMSEEDRKRYLMPSEIPISVGPEGTKP